MQPPRRSKRSDELTPAARALRLLGRRDYTRAELGRKLAEHVESPEQLESLLDDLARRGWLSESRVLEQVIHAKRSRFGIARLRHALVTRGVQDDLIGPALDQLKGGEMDAARAVRSRKFQEPPSSRADAARQVRFLQSRGFSLDIAMRVVRDAGESKERE